MGKTTEIMIAGFGGQGILFSGKVIAYAGLMNNKEVSWLPSYGPEMRGGTANCHIIISDEPVGSPIIVNPDVLIVMNKPSLEKFENAVKPGGVIIIDSTLIDRKVTRDDVTVKYVDATQIAMDNNSPKLANMVIIGAMLKATGVMTLDEIKKGVEKSTPASKAHLVDSNMGLISAGYNG